MSLGYCMKCREHTWQIQRHHVVYDKTGKKPKEPNSNEIVVELCTRCHQNIGQMNRRAFTAYSELNGEHTIARKDIFRSMIFWHWISDDSWFSDAFNDPEHRTMWLKELFARFRNQFKLIAIPNPKQGEDRWEYHTVKAAMTMYHLECNKRGVTVLSVPLEKACATGLHLVKDPTAHEGIKCLRKRMRDGGDLAEHTEVDLAVARGCLKIIFDEEKQLQNV